MALPEVVSSATSLEPGSLCCPGWAIGMLADAVATTLTKLGAPR